MTATSPKIRVTRPGPIRQQLFIGLLLLGGAIFLFAACLFVRESAQLRSGPLHIKVNSVYSRLSWQDILFNKTITITHKDKTIKLSYQSIEPDIYFYVKDHSVLVLDRYSGANEYDLQTLRLISSPDCLAGVGACGGFDEVSFKAQGTPTLVFEGLQ